MVCSGGSLLPTFQDHVSPIFTPEDGIDMLSQNVSNKLPCDATNHPRQGKNG